MWIMGCPILDCQPMPNIVLNRKKLRAFPVKSGARQGYQLTFRQEKKKEGYELERKKSIRFQLLTMRLCPWRKLKILQTTLKTDKHSQQSNGLRRRHKKPVGFHLTITDLQREKPERKEYLPLMRASKSQNMQGVSWQGVELENATFEEEAQVRRDKCRTLALVCRASFYF